MEPTQNILKDIRAALAIRISVVIVLLALAVFLVAETTSVVQSFGTSANPPANTITVSGEGTATAIPDTATISFGATQTAADVGTAETKVTAEISAALSSVTDAGIASSDITTDSFNVSPHYVNSAATNGIACPPNVPCMPVTNQVAQGYNVSETVTVKIHDTSKVPGILAGLAKANVTNISGPSFVVDDTQVVMAQARGQAILKAQVDAKKLASQLGVHLGKVASFSDNPSGVVEPMAKSMAMGVANDVAPVTPAIPVGENTYSDSVSITYAVN
jgi:uncharacterized protein YggE